MDYQPHIELPSKVGLLLGRVWNYLSVFILGCAVSSIARAFLPFETAQLVAGILTIGFSLGLVLYRKLIAKHADVLLADIRRAAGPVKHGVPDYWQLIWLAKTYQYDWKKGEEWRSTQAVVLFFITLNVVFGFYTWKYPAAYGSGPGLAMEIPVICLSILFASMCFLFSQDPWYAARKRRGGDGGPGSPPSGPPDDNGPAGVGARLVPPVPTLEVGERVRA